MDPTLFARAAKYMRMVDWMSINLEELKANAQQQLARDIQVMLAGTETHRDMEKAIGNTVARLELIDMLISTKRTAIILK